MKQTLILILAVLGAVAHPTQAQNRWLSYEPETVELDGKLVIQSKYGPPNYGEQPKTDEKVRVPVLLLGKPVNTIGVWKGGHNEKSVYGARQIQLAFSPATPYKTWIGKNVVVKGTLFHAFSGHHYTEVVMNVVSIESKPAGYDQRRFDVCTITTSEWNLRERRGTSNELLSEFRAMAGDEATRKSIKHLQTGLIINAGVEFDGTLGDPVAKPSHVRIAISISDTEKDPFDVLDNAVAGADYRRDWGYLWVERRVVVGDVEHRFSLHCSDGATKRKR